MTSDRPSSVLVVDDHAVIGAAMAVALRGAAFDPVVAMDGSDLTAHSVLDTARSLRPDIVLLDLYLGAGVVSVPLIAPLVGLGAKVVMFTAGTDPALIAGCLRAGAEAIVDKAMSFEKVVGTLMAVATGAELMLAHEKEALIEAFESRSTAEQARFRRFDSLTEREATVLRSLIDGEAPKYIAHALGISVSTVRGHIERIFHKLGVASQREALAVARSEGWPGRSDM